MNRKTLGAFILAVIMTFTVSACGNIDKAETTVWTAPSTVKIMQKKDYSPSENLALNISMAKNEYESAQIIISAKSDIGEYDIVLSDLKNANGDTLSKDNISVFNQHYIETTISTTPSFEKGWYPDGLIPFINAKNAHENNVKTNENQGLWVRVFAPENLSGGEYKGEFVLSIDNECVNISVTVNVWDIAIPNEVHTKSSFFTRKDQLIYGELDDSLEMQKAYYDFFLDYRISSLDIPYQTLNTKDFISQLIKYYDNPKFSAYAVPHLTYRKYAGVNEIDYERLNETLMAIAKICTENKNYFDKAYFYIHDIIDEPDQSGGQLLANRIGRELTAACKRAVNELKSENKDFFKNMPNVETSLLGIEHIVTAKYFDGDNGEKNTDITGWCVQSNNIHEAKDREFYQKLQADKIANFWWYTCLAPKYPYTSYHIDDNAIGARIMSWMQKDYDIQGVLYWATNMYTSNFDESLRGCDAYNNPLRLDTTQPTNGDGYLVYPGIKYGLKKPIGSIRLEQIRDGLEDYEMLYMLDNNYKSLSAFYNRQLNYKTEMQILYDSLYQGNIPITDSQTDIFNRARSELACAAQSSAGEEKLAIDKISFTDDTATVEVLLNDGYTVIQNGAVINGEVAGGGKKYTFNVKLNNPINYLQFEYEKNGVKKSVKKFLASRVQMICGFEEEIKSGVRLSEGGAMSLNTDKNFSLSGNSYKFDIKVNGEDSAFKPQIEFDKEFFGNVKFEQIDNMKLELYNANADSYNLYMYFVAGREKLIASIELKSGFNTLDVKKLFAVGWSDLKNTKKVILRLENKNPESGNMRVLYLDSMRVTFNE